VQQSLREDAPSVREPQAAAAHASSPAPLRWRLVGRAFVIGALIGAFLAFVGVHTAYRPDGLVGRMAYMIAIAWVGTALGIAVSRVTPRLPGLANRPWAQALAGGAMMAAPMGAAVWLGDRILAPEHTTLSDLIGYLGISLVISVAMNALAAGLRRERTVIVAIAPPAPPKFLERLPLKLRGAELWAVEAEDHYLRLHTSKGQDLILLRLADAIAELEGIEGAQTHRSWWVARDAIAAAERGDGRAVLTLKDGTEVPVSRTYAKALRERRWF
jgi:hypothetical protein